MLALATAAAGCASDTTYDSASRVNGPATASVRSAYVEADGLPPQVAPPQRSIAEPDNPAEPYSRNYGRAHASGPRLSDADANALIATAILAHELRHQDRR